MSHAHRPARERVCFGGFIHHKGVKEFRKGFSLRLSNVWRLIMQPVNKIRTWRNSPSRRQSTKAKELLSEGKSTEAQSLFKAAVRWEPENIGAQCSPRLGKEGRRKGAFGQLFVCRFCMAGSLATSVIRMCLRQAEQSDVIFDEERSMKHWHLQCSSTVMEQERCSMSREAIPVPCICMTQTH